MKTKPMLRVAILGPVSTISRGDEAEQFLNVRRMCKVGADLVQLGVLPYVPGLNCFWHMMQPMARDLWVLISQEEIRRSDACYRMGGPSNGAEQEILFAKEIGKPVFYTLDEVERWAREIQDEHPNVWSDDDLQHIPEVDFDRNTHIGRGSDVDIGRTIADFDRKSKGGA